MIAEWEAENGKVLVDLAVNKDVQDAILNDPVRSKIVDIIDIEQWFYHNKGEYAPEGGVNMAQRQYMRKIRTGSARFEDVYRAVSEYRTKYGKAVIYSAQKAPELGWASLMAGGSCAAIPVKDKTFLQSISSMKPSKMGNVYSLEGEDGKLICILDQQDILVSLPENNTYILNKVDEKTGKIVRLRPVKRNITLKEKGVFWLKKK